MSVWRTDNLYLPVYLLRVNDRKAQFLTAETCMSEISMLMGQFGYGEDLSNVNTYQLITNDFSSARFYRYRLGKVKADLKAYLRPKKNAPCITTQSAFYISKPNP